MDRKRSQNLPTVDQLIKGRVYVLRCRNLKCGVWDDDGKGGFIGIRSKLGSQYLFMEYHWDVSRHCGTVTGIKDTGIDVPPNIPITINEGTSKKQFRENKQLFEFLEQVEKRINLDFP